MRALGNFFFPVALIAGCAPAGAAEGFLEAGAAKLAAYLVCRPLASVDMGAAGGESATECDGIVHNLDNEKTPDNLAIHCLEHTADRSGKHSYSGACVQTDGDGDKLYMTYEGSKSGQFKWIGGTGKFKAVSGAGSLGVVVAPGGSATLFAYTLHYDATWSSQPK